MDGIHLTNILAQEFMDHMVQTLSIKKLTRILDILKVKLMKVFTNLQLRIQVSIQPHTLDNKKLTLIMAIRIQISNGLIKKNLHCPNINTNIIITTRLRILETVVFLRKFNNSHLMINQFYHNHGEEQRKHIQSTDSKTTHGTTSMLLKLDTSITITITPKHKILEIVELLKKFNNSHPMINQCSHNHGEG